MNSKTIWLTGLSGAGKTTIAEELKKKIEYNGRKVIILDGDIFRKGLCIDLGYSIEDRTENIRRAAEVAKIINDSGIDCICAFISPMREERMYARNIIGERFIEVYISTPLEECERRDVKGLYKKVRRGEVKSFTGISSPYEVPLKPDLIIDTTNRVLNECVEKILNCYNCLE